MSTPDTDGCARRASTSRKVAALTAIIQTLLPEVFCKVGEEPDERLFVEMVKQGDPVSMAIANELTPEEIAAAFGWRDQPNGTMETEIRAMPVMAVLGEEQREAARVMCVAEEAADRIYALARENKGTATGEGGAMRRCLTTPPSIHQVCNRASMSGSTPHRKSDGSARRRRPSGGKYLTLVSSVVLAMALWLMTGTGHADSLERLIERLDRLEQENRQLRKEIDALKAARQETAPRAAAPASESPAAQFVHVDSEYGYEILDPTTNINRKQRLILDRKKDGTLAPDRLHVQGAITAIANYQSSNRDDKFGYLMRHPTAANRVGDTVSEATIHSAQLGFTGTLGDWLTGHAVMLFDPEQSFGKGTNTDLERNQLQMRRAYVLLGDLDRSPFYASLGKMAVPFGLTDTVSPFTASTVWHAFGGLANGVTVGYVSEGLNVSLMGIQGGAQFRAANTPVEGTGVPSKLNNFAVDAHYGFELGSAGTLLLGGSYVRGTAYCQDFPVVHFEPCQDNNPAFDVYGKLVYRDFTFKGELARTTDEWPGTFNPDIPQFAASKVTSFDIGARYRYDSGAGPVDLSAEFSRFVAGPDGAPWEHQDQIVLGAAWFVRPSAKLFAEYIRVNGFAPLNFISGGSVRGDMGEVIPDQTISDRSAHSDVIMVGVNVAF